MPPRPTLILLPGLDGTGRLFDPLVAALSDEMDVKVVSYPTDAVLDYPDLTDMVAEVVPTDMPFVILAESFSGPIALAYAARRPPNLVGLIICASFLTNPLPRWLLWPLRYVNAMIPNVRLPVPLYVVRRMLLSSDTSTEIVRALDEAVSSVETRVLRGRVESIRTVDAGDALRICATPIHYLRAGNDRLVGERGEKQFRAIHSNITFHTIGGPHLLLQSRPHEAATLIDSIVKRTSSEASTA